MIKKKMAKRKKMKRRMIKKTIRKKTKKTTRKTIKKTTRRMMMKKRRKTRRRKKKRRKIRNQVRPLGKSTMAAKKLSWKPKMETAPSKLKTFTSLDPTISSETTKCSNLMNPVWNSFNSKTDLDFG